MYESSNYYFILGRNTYPLWQQLRNNCHAMSLSTNKYSKCTFFQLFFFYHRLEQLIATQGTTENFLSNKSELAFMCFVYARISIRLRYFSSNLNLDRASRKFPFLRREGSFFIFRRLKSVNLRACISWKVFVTVVH